MRLCLAKKDYIRAQILARKISPRAFQKQQGDSKGEIGIEGTAIEEADKVRVGVCWTFLCVPRQGARGGVGRSLSASVSRESKVLTAAAAAAAAAMTAAGMT